MNEDLDRTGTANKNFEFSFCQQRFSARPGDTLAIALHRAGVKTLGKSPVEHRPRGLRWFDRRSELAVCVGDDPRCFDPAQVLLSPEMDIKTANWVDAPPPNTAQDISCETAVIGAGPAGLAAALTLCRSGAEVVVVTRERQMGETAAGQVDPETSHWMAETIEELRQSGVSFLTQTRALSATDKGWRLETEGPSATTEYGLQVKTSIYAGGARERMIAFCGNDLPGVMTSHALARLTAADALAPGQRIALFTNNDRAYENIAAVERTGGQIVAVVDVREHPLSQSDRPWFSGVVSRAHGKGTLERIEITQEKGPLNIDCDTLAVSGGWSPQIAPLISRDKRPMWNPTIEAWLSPPGTWPNISVAGAAGGSFSNRAAIKSGYFRARRALTEIGRDPVPISIPRVSDSDGRTAAFWWVPGGTHSTIDFERDITLQARFRATGDNRFEDIARRYLANPAVW